MTIGYDSAWNEIRIFTSFHNMTGRHDLAPHIRANVTAALNEEDESGDLPTQLVPEQMTIGGLDIPAKHSRTSAKYNLSSSMCSERLPSS